MAYLDEHGLGTLWNKIKLYVKGQVETGGIETPIGVSLGGTGRTTRAAARDYFGLGNTTGPVPIDCGGTGASTAEGARSALNLGNSSQPTFAGLNLGSPLTVSNGGTGKSTHTANSILVGNGTASIKNTATGNGAFYATAANGAAQFGTLPIAQGGTGMTSSPSMLVNLASNSAASIITASPRPGVTGVLPVANGGTGATSAVDARAAIGLGASSDVAFGSLELTGELQAASAVYSDGVHSYGAMRFNLDDQKFEYWNGSAWVTATPAEPRIYYGSDAASPGPTGYELCMWKESTFKTRFHATNPSLCMVSFANGHYEAAHIGTISAEWWATGDYKGWHARWQNEQHSNIRVNWTVIVPPELSTV